MGPRCVQLTCHGFRHQGPWCCPETLLCHYVGCPPGFLQSHGVCQAKPLEPETLGRSYARIIYATMGATWMREHDTDTKPVLYGNFQHPQVDTIPSRDATSAEVREYLTSVLKTKHGLPDDEAQRVADRWTVGRGHELRSYTAQIYLDIFGRDVGWVLYRDIQLEVYRTRQRTFWETRGLYITAFISFAFAFAIFMVALRDINPAVNIVCSLLFTFGALVCVLSVCFLCMHIFEGNQPEKQIEGALQRCLHPGTTSAA